jgi:tRNA(fMet)-specific endonuclease VapC
MSVTACVVDTDVVSLLFKNAPTAKAYFPHLTGRLLVISFMTVAELDRWALHRNWGAGRVARMNSHLQQFVFYPADRALCSAWAAITNAEQRKGRIISTADAWIAATAIVNSIPLVTHNKRHFETVDNLQVISEA